MRNLKNILGIFLILVFILISFFPFSYNQKNAALPLIKIAETENTQFFMQGDEMIKRVITGEIARDFIVKIFAGKTFLIPLDGEKIIGDQHFDFLKDIFIPIKEKIVFAIVLLFTSSLSFIFMKRIFYQRKIPWKYKNYELLSIIRSREWFVFAMIPLRNR